MDNSVFISYRLSVSEYLARGIFSDLHTNNIDVLIAVDNSDPEFDTMMLNQIAARPYFLLVLRPKTLDRCVEPNDGLLRQIEHAMKLNRVIIPIATEDFSFDDA